MPLYVCNECEPHDGTVCAQRTRDDVQAHQCPGEGCTPRWVLAGQTIELRRGG